MCTCLAWKPLKIFAVGELKFKVSVAGMPPSAKPRAIAGRETARRAIVVLMRRAIFVKMSCAIKMGYSVKMARACEIISKRQFRVYTAFYTAVHT